MLRKTRSTKGAAKRWALLAACLMAVNGLWAQEKATVYLSLKQGDVTISEGKLTAFKRSSGSSWTQVTNETIDYNNTYEIGMWASGENPENVTPRAVTTTNDGTVDIVNRYQENLNVLNEWDTKGASARNAYKSSYCIEINHQTANTLNVVLNNCWSIKEPYGFNFTPGTTGATTKLRVGLKGDNRFYHVRVSTEKSPNAITELWSEIHFYSVTANNKGTLTVGKYGATSSLNEWGGTIGAPDDNRTNQMHFDGGTIYAGNTAAQHGCAIGAGGNSVGSITVDGAVITAVSCGDEGATIGGAGGGGGGAGNGHFTMKSGTVYAFSYGDHTRAIGGGYDHTLNGNGSAYVNISGGTIYAKATSNISVGSGSSGDLSFTMSGGTLITQTIAGVTCVTIDGTNYLTATEKLTANITGGTIRGQFETSNNNSSFTMSNATILGPYNSVYTYNQADGGAIHWGGTGTVTINSGTIDGCIGANGGAIWLDNGTLNMTGGTITGCSATGNGGGVYVETGTVKLHGGTIQDCTAVIGGGLYAHGDVANSLKPTVSVKNFNFLRCSASYEDVTTVDADKCFGGGAIHLDYDKSATDYIQFSMENTIIDGCTALKTHGGAISNYGYAHLVITGTTFKNCSAKTGGAITIRRNTGRLTMSNCIGENCVATGRGGGFLYVNSSTDGSNFSITNSTFRRCKATTGAGGAMHYSEVYGDQTVTISGCTIENCEAATTGGGITMNRTGSTLNLNGCIITGCTATSNGGGIYFNGATFNVGASGSTAITVRGNTRGGVANDIYLPSGKKINVVGDAFNPQDVGIYTESGTNDPIAVLTTDTPARLTTLWNAINAGTKNLFPDRTEYKVKPYSGSGDLYFYKNNDSPWSAEQKTVGATDLRLVNGVYEISNVKELTAFLWYVNNIDTHHNFDANAHPEANGKLTADIDMGGHYWVPIGTNYTGTFDGNGHTIKNLKMARTNPSTGRGLFGTVSTGTIKNVQLVGCDFYDYQSGIGTTYMGCIVAQMTGTGATLMNSVANGTLKTTNPSGVMGGLAGNNGGSIHSSFASATLNGYTMGGLVGNNSSNLKNSFANAKFASSGEGYVGGLVGVNSGTVENCYVREQSGSSHGSSFGWCVGDNSGTIAYCYIPADETVYKAHGTAQANTCTTYGTTQTPYLYKHADNQMTANANNNHIVNGAFDRNGLKGLLATLNHWVGSNGTYARWMRTSASPINNDYPIFDFTNAVCVGSPDNINLEYSADFNDKFGKYITANSGTIYLYQSPSADVTSTLSNSSGTPALYIHEDVALKHTSTIKAHVGVTLDNSAGTNGANPTFGGGSTDAVDWHFFSSALSDAPLGISYTDNAEYKYNQNSSLPKYQFTAANGYFPTGVYGSGTTYDADYYPDWDFYAYYEPDYHWINFKRNGNSHWHEDLLPTEPEANRAKINYKSNGTGADYTNESTLIRGRGYMVALKEEGYLQAYGTLNQGDINVPVTKTEGIEWTMREGQNMLGNPYQSYLDFNAFAANATNANLWNSGTDPFYIVMDEDEGDYVTYHVSQSVNTDRASRYIYPHQGFMVKIDAAGTAQFTDDMRSVSTTGSYSASFRGDDHADYPLVNLFAKDMNGNRDMVTVELGRPDKGGLLKSLVPGSSTGSLYCRYEEKDYDLAFTEPGLVEAAIRFTTSEDMEYTMTWNTQNGEFGYLHLIDNMTGADVDCLTTEEYRFSARTSDYASRFRLVFDYTGIDDHEAPEPLEGSACFAFQMGDQLVVNGEGILQLFDVTGRLLLTTEVSGSQTTMQKPNVGAGIYLLRLTNDNGSKTQKIVIK